MVRDILCDLIYITLKKSKHAGVTMHAFGRLEVHPLYLRSKPFEAMR
jgi:hypothetical protein